MFRFPPCISVITCNSVTHYRPFTQVTTPRLQKLQHFTHFHISGSNRSTNLVPFTTHDHNPAQARACLSAGDSETAQREPPRLAASSRCELIGGDAGRRPGQHARRTGRRGGALWRPGRWGRDMSGEILHQLGGAAPAAERAIAKVKGGSNGGRRISGP